MKITRRQLRRLIRESLISEQVMWHSTAPENVEGILSQGLQPGRESANTMGGAWADEFYGKRPIYLSVEKGKYEGTPLAVNAANLDLVADLPTLVDTGAYQEEEGMYWDEGKEPQQMSNLIDEDGMVYFEDLLSPGSAEAQAAIEITGTAAVIDGVPPESIATEEGDLKSNKPSAAESEWASKSQAEKDDHVKSAVWETMAWKRYRKHAQAEGIPFDPDDEEDMKVARAWWKEQPESKQFESKMRITDKQLRGLIREELLREGVDPRGLKAMLKKLNVRRSFNNLTDVLSTVFHEFEGDAADMKEEVEVENGVRDDSGTAINWPLDTYQQIHDLYSGQKSTYKAPRGY